VINSEVILTDCCEIISGSTPSRKIDEYWGGNINWFTPKDLSKLKSKYIQSSPEKITQKGLANCSAKLLPVKSLLLSSRAPIGHIAINREEACTNQGFKSLVPKSNLNIEYLYYAIMKIVPKLKDLGNGATFKEISKETLSRVSIPLPPLPEQKKIADILDAADSLRQKDQQLVEHYDRLSQSLFLDMFGDPVTNPMGWERKSISELCSHIVDCVNRTAKTVDFETKYKMIRTTNVRNYKIDIVNVRYVEKDVYDKWVRRLTPKKGDIIFTREAPVGEAGILETDDSVFLGQRTMEYRVNHEIVTPDYLLHELMGSNIKNQIRRLSSGSTVQHLSVLDCKKFQINLPPIKLQNEFSKRIKEIEKQKELAQQSLKKSEDLFNSLLQRAFKGELTHTQ